MFRHTPVDNKSYFSRGQIHTGLVKSLPRSVSRVLGRCGVCVLDRRPTGFAPVVRRPECKKRRNGKFRSRNIERLEKMHDDSNRMHETANFLRRLKPKEKLIIQSKEGKTSNPKDCAEILKEHFQGVFYNKNCKPIPEIQPTEMRTPFTEEEIQHAVMSMKNNKSGGCDLMTPELIKYVDKEISKGIASILNNTRQENTLKN